MENADNSEPIAWRAARPDSPIQDSRGTVVGSLIEILGSTEEDIFHGIVVKLSSGGRHVFVPVDEIDDITGAYLRVDLTADALAALPAYEESASFHVGMVGTFKKHAGWIRDDQE